MTPSDAVRRPSWPMRLLMALVRILFLTVLFAALGMALGLMTGIFLTIAGAAVHGSQPDMRQAYLRFAIPFAAVTGGATFLFQVVNTLRRLGRN